MTLFNDAQFSFEDHLRHADNAMYQSKAAGRNTYRFYDKVTQAELEKNFALESALNLALKNQEFHLNFQSIVDAEQVIVGAEVLLRWSHPKLGNVSPVEFIPLLKKIIRLSKLVIGCCSKPVQSLKLGKAILL